MQPKCSKRFFILFIIIYQGTAIINKGPAFLAKHLQRSLAELSIFTTEGLAEGSNSDSYDTKLNALTVRPRCSVSISTLDAKHLN